MKRSRWIPLLICTAIAVGTLTSCGSDSRPEARTPTARQAFAHANANCRQLLRDVRQLAKGVLSGYSSNLELTTEGFAKPGIRLEKHIARRQQRLQPAADDPRYSLYAELFDPIIVLAEQRLQAGQAGDIAQSQLLQDQLTALGIEQRDAARRAGLRSCDVDFLDVMVRAATN